MSLAPKSGEPWRPILIVPGSRENCGRRVLTSAVTFACDDIDADDFLTSQGHGVAASTAILNSARFPWISPGGAFSDARCKAGGDFAPAIKDHVLDGGYFDNAGAETLREMVRKIRAAPDGSGAVDKLRIIFVLIGYRDPDAVKPTPALALNDVFAPLFGLFNGMSGHETHLAREMKLTGQTAVVDPDPYVSRMNGENGIDYAAIVLCPGQIKFRGRTIDYDPPMDWTLSGEAKRYIENSVIPGTGACAADANAKAIDDVVQRLAP